MRMLSFVLFVVLCVVRGARADFGWHMWVPDSTHTHAPGALSEYWGGNWHYSGGAWNSVVGGWELYVSAAYDGQSAHWAVDGVENTAAAGSYPYTLVTFGAAPSYAATRWEASITNSGVLTETYRVSVNYTNGTSTNWTFTALPGVVTALSVQETNAFTASVERYAPSGLGQDVAGWTPAGTGGAVTNLSSSSPLGRSASTTSGSVDVWTNPNGLILGPLPNPITSTPAGTRQTGTDAVTRASAAQANADQRLSELQSVLVAQDARSAQRAAVQTAVMGQGLDRVRDAIASVGSTLAGLTNGATNGYLPGGSGPATNGVGLANLTNLFRSWWPSNFTAPSTNGQNFAIAIPLASLDSRLSDLSIDFVSDAHLAPYVRMFRGFALLVVTFLFFLATLRLVGIMGGSGS